MEKVKAIKDFLQPYLEVVRHDHVIIGAVLYSSLKRRFKLSYIEKKDFEDSEFDGFMRTVDLMDDEEFGQYLYGGDTDWMSISSPYLFVLSERVGTEGWKMIKVLDLETLDVTDVDTFVCDINGIIK